MILVDLYKLLLKKLILVRYEKSFTVSFFQVFDKDNYILIIAKSLKNIPKIVHLLKIVRKFLALKGTLMQI